VVSFLHIFLPMFDITPVRAAGPAHFILRNFITLIISVEPYNTSYEAPHYAVFFSLPPILPPLVQIFTSAPCSQMSSICVLPLG